MALKEYTVTFTLKVTETVEAENKEEAEQAFSEMFSDGADLLEYGSYKIERVKATPKVSWAGARDRNGGI